jgi:hypothetical protein
MIHTLLTAALLAGIRLPGAPTPIAGIESTVRHCIDQAQQPAGRIAARSAQPV